MKLVDDLSDILAALPADDAYDRFKATVLLRTTISESSRLHQLFNAEELSDQRPMQMLLRMRELSRTQRFQSQESFFWGAILERLPTNMRKILASACNVPLDSLAEMTDKISGYVLSAIASFFCESDYRSRGTSPDTDAINAFQLSRRGRRRSSRRSLPRPGSPAAVRRSPSSNRQDDDLCRYHARLAFPFFW